MLRYANDVLGLGTNLALYFIFFTLCTFQIGTYAKLYLNLPSVPKTRIDKLIYATSKLVMAYFKKPET